MKNNRITSVLTFIYLKSGIQLLDYSYLKTKIYIYKNVIIEYNLNN